MMTGGSPNLGNHHIPLKILSRATTIWHIWLSIACWMGMRIICQDDAKQHQPWKCRMEDWDYRGQSSINTDGETCPTMMRHGFSTGQFRVCQSWNTLSVRQRAISLDPNFRHAGHKSNGWRCSQFFSASFGRGYPTFRSTFKSLKKRTCSRCHSGFPECLLVDLTHPWWNPPWVQNFAKRLRLIPTWLV